jgi:hypothetical protein
MKENLLQGTLKLNIWYFDSDMYALGKRFADTLRLHSKD